MEPPRLQISTNENNSTDNFYNYMRVDSPDRPVRESDDIPVSDGEYDQSIQERYHENTANDARPPPGNHQGELYTLDSVPLDNGNDITTFRGNEFRNYNLWARIFTIISVVSAVLILIFEIYMYAVINIHKVAIGFETKYRELSIYLALFIFASIFQVFITWLGLRTKNILLLLALCVFYGCMLIYTGIQYQEINHFVSRVLVGHWKVATRAMNISTIVVLAITMILQVYLILRHLNSYVNWFSFKTIGGDLRIKRLYQVFQIHRSLLIFGFFFFLGFTIQFIIIMAHSVKRVEFILTIIVLPLTIILLIISDLVMAKEILILSILCMIIYLGGIAYVLFKIIRLYTKYTSAYSLTLKPGDYFPGRKSLVTFGIITLILLFAIVTIEIILMVNFNKGLKTTVGHPNYLIFPINHNHARKSIDEKPTKTDDHDDELSIS